MDCALSKTFLEQFVCRANDVFFLKLVKTIEDIDDDKKSFHPEFTHQFFGDSENIFGYKNLKINMFYSASKLNLYFNISYSEQIDSKLAEGLEADDILNIIKQKLDLQNHFTNLDKFVQCLNDEIDFLPYGEKLYEFNNSDQCFEIYFANSSTPNFIQNYHEQMQHFSIMFIDGASYIDIDDDNWDYFVVYEKCKTSNKSQYFFVGYCTVYRFYAYPENLRPRISQILLLPPFQKKNIGYHLLQTITNYYLPNPKVVDITVEDPSDNFSQLRNYVDCKNCLSLKEFNKENLKKGWSKEMEKVARNTFKIHKFQSRKVYEILKLMQTNLNDKEDYKNYRIEVKRRLNAPLVKSKKSKMSIDKKDTEVMPKEAIIEQLAAAYNELEQEYFKTIEKLKVDN